MGNNISYTASNHVLDLGNLGSLKGVQFDNKARRYLGVPYALPPTGDYRWKKPRPPPSGHSYTSDGNPFIVQSLDRFALKRIIPGKDYFRIMCWARIA
jgi:carboxylesterase type B